MILGVLLLTVALATILAAFQFKRSSRALYLVALIAFLLAGSGLPANALLDNLQEGLDVRTDPHGQFCDGGFCADRSDRACRRQRDGGCDDHAQHLERAFGS